MKKVWYAIRGTVRFVCFLWITFTMAFVAFVAQIFGARFRFTYKIFNAWKWLLYWSMGMEVETEGTIPDVSAVIMPNHRSYIDIIILPSKVPLVFVAKAEVKKWPIVGWGAERLETVWVDRSNHNSRKHTLDQIRKRLAKKESVIVFPEGTTHRGPETLPLKQGMFHILARGGFPVVPVAIEYENQNMAWVGDDTFVPHFVAQFGKPRVKVKVRFGDPMTDTDPAKLHSDVSNWMNNNLLEMRKQWDNSSVKDPARRA